MRRLFDFRLNVARYLEARVKIAVPGVGDRACIGYIFRVEREQARGQHHRGGDRRSYTYRPIRNIWSEFYRLGRPRRPESFRRNPMGERRLTTNERLRHGSLRLRRATAPSPFPPGAGRL